MKSYSEAMSRKCEFYRWDKFASTNSGLEGETRGESLFMRKLGPVGNGFRRGMDSRRREVKAFCER